LLAQRLVVLAIVAAVCGAVLGFVFAGSPSTIAAGVKIDGVDVGGLSAPEARAPGGRGRRSPSHVHCRRP
jgi:hypothetical protein